MSSKQLSPIHFS
uniref:Uncharacterized protein n=1 Tax=Anguilla anguilla TaxID=7936 RepID=A0A0E9SHJ0_ANGAN